MKFIKSILFYFFGVIGILCISVFPEYITSIQITNGANYFVQLFSFIASLANPDSWVYTSYASTKGFPIFSVLFEPFIYSMKILFGAIFFGFIIAFLLAILFKYFNRRAPIIKSILDFLESIPDLLIATLLQALSVFIFQKTGVDLFRVAGFKEPVYFAPIVTLAILPAISFLKILLLLIEEESIKNYVLFLKGKGIGTLKILLQHIFRNIMPGLSQRMKVIIWGTLSSQYIIEYIFNIHGIYNYLLESFTPITIFTSLLLIFTPFYVIFQILDYWLEDTTENSMDKIERRNKISLSKRLKIWKDDILFTMKKLRIKNNGFLRGLRNGFRSLIPYLKNIKIIIGSLFFILTIGYSFIYSLATDSQVDQVMLLYEEDGITLLSTPPHAPTEPFLFGSDRYGNSIFDQIVVGAKYTLFFGLAIACLRVVGGLIFGMLFAFYFNQRWQRWFEKLVDSLHFVPLSVIAYVLLAPILVSHGHEFSFSLTERILIEILILTLFVLPLTTVLIGKDIKNVTAQEYILSAKTVGCSKFYLFSRYILPQISPKMSILFGQQFIQVLLIFIHLGIFDLYFGGTKLIIGFDSAPVSVTYEWSGLIGAIGRMSMRTGQYWYLLVLVAFILAIFAMQLIIKGITDVQQSRIGVLHRFRKKRFAKKADPSFENTELLSEQNFRWMEKNDLNV
ncbi:ABC transporter permease subunit [Caldibacillus lycopersici]|uniref:ABC transporter permease subunit n=1 Tax=Perspicuibacillus lycopersici TaxID=1325689 RepID=A0AAE3IVW1_9BACI|nr:ABC transporter permease subunit [Perspicuibacillus lycopersici]MCU9614568.1 ABC transporter permease subunit [Perspicuibacillus lycopersici]